MRPLAPSLSVPRLKNKAYPRTTSCRSGECGQALVEFALTLPVLLLIVTGIFSFGITINNYIGMTDATSAGAREFALMRGQNGDPCAVAASTVATSAPLLRSGSSNALSYSITVGGSTYTSSSPSCASATLTQGQPVKMVVTYPCSLLVYGWNAAPSCLLTAQTSELIQ